MGIEHYLNMIKARLHLYSETGLMTSIKTLMKQPGYTYGKWQITSKLEIGCVRFTGGFRGGHKLDVKHTIRFIIIEAGKGAKGLRTKWGSPESAGLGNGVLSSVQGSVAWPADK